MVRKSSTQGKRFLHLFANLKCPDGSDFENFLIPNYRNFAGQCDWNSRISQLLIKFGFIGKNGVALAITLNRP